MKCWPATLLALAVLVAAGNSGRAQVCAMTPGGAVAPDGRTEVKCDLPGSERMHNAAGRDGAGLCVFTSIEHCGRWQHIAELVGFQKRMTNEPGGGYPEKVVAMLKRYAPDVVDDCLQHTGGDVEWLKAALATGRMVGITYCGHDPRYGAQTIAHMVNLVYLDDKWGCILDNNYPEQFLWMSASELIERWRGETADGKKFLIRDGRRTVPVGGGWALAFTNPPPPPVPRVK